MRTATLDEPEHGLTEEVLDETDVLIWWGHKAHGEVDDAIVDRVQARVLDGMGLVVLHSGHYLEDLQEADGHDLRPEVARGRRQGAALGRRAGPPDRRGPRRVHRARARGDVRRALRHPRARDSWSSSPGSPAARSSAAAAATTRGAGKIFYFRPGHETYPTYYNPEIRRVIANGARWAAPANGPKRAFGNRKPLEKL